MIPFSPVAMWLIVGVLLVGLEMLTGTFMLLLLAVSCFLTAIAVWVGLTVAFQSQLMFMGVVSLATLLIFRTRIREAWAKRAQVTYTSDLGEEILLTTDIAVGESVEVNYQGTKWTAQNQSGRVLYAGQTVRIARADGVKLILE